MDLKTRVKIPDDGAYGLIVVQGIGKINRIEVSRPAQIR